jgi:hypothetical protein
MVFISITIDWWSSDILRNEKWELKIENLIKMNLRSRKERQTTEYQTAEHAINKKNYNNWWIIEPEEWKGRHKEKRS